MHLHLLHCLSVQRVGAIPSYCHVPDGKKHPSGDEDGSEKTATQQHQSIVDMEWQCGKRNAYLSHSYKYIYIYYCICIHLFMVVFAIAAVSDPRGNCDFRVLSG